MEPQDGSEEGFGIMFWLFLMLGIIGVVGFFMVAGSIGS
jgi:hypothetical protein